MAKISFNLCLKEYLEKEFENIFKSGINDFNIQVSEDINTWLLKKEDFNENDVFIIFNTGNATATTTEDKLYTQTLTINIFCSLNKKDKVKALLNDYVLKQDSNVVGIGNTKGTLYPYYVALTYNTPYSDSISRVANGNEYAIIFLAANLIWSETDFDVEAVPDVLIDDKPLLNVYSINYKKSVIVNSYLALGRKFQKHIENYQENVYTLNFLQNKNNSLHDELHNPGLHLIKIGNEEEFTGFINVEYTKARGSYTAITLTVTR